MSGRLLYDWWSRNPWALRGLYALAFLGRERTFRRRSIDALDLEPGDHVLELGCGNGNSFPRLREAVGSDGRVVGVDYSPGMASAAADRVAENGWENVHVVHGDATTLGVRSDAFDAAYASMSLSAMPDPVAAVETAARCLHENGRLAVLDARPFQPLPLRPLNLLIVPISKRLTDWQVDVDIPAAIDERFAEASVDGYNGGTIYIASASGPRKRDAGGD